MSERSAHKTVLLDEAVDLLVTDPAGKYVDGTFGRGGHSQLILNKLDTDGKLLAIDRDLQAVNYGRERFKENKSFSLEHAEFSSMKALAAVRGWEGKVSGVLLDLGVSSPQLDESERGFSFLRSGPLDMRMNQSSGESAAEWLARAKQEEIVSVLREFGEERFARRIAGAIVERREAEPLLTTGQLASLIAEAMPVKEGHKHPATRSFQAIRIYINRELEELKQALSDSLELLAPGGRLVVISFHSLEDRIVKRFMRDSAAGPKIPKGVPVMAKQVQAPIRIIGKALKPAQEEIRQNPRARSAVLRVAERVAVSGAVQ
jgi:16S rRNA (cytosine1402-N4)-methyltransferase